MPTRHYCHTLLSNGARLMRTVRIAATLLLYGDNAASAIVDEAGGSGDFTAELAARILDGEELNSDGITGLLKQTVPEEDEETSLSTPGPCGRLFGQ